MKNDEIDNVGGYDETDQEPITFPRNKDLNFVIEDLHKRYPDAIFHIGAGSSYLFVGSYDLYVVDMPEISKALTESMKIRLVRAKNRLAENRKTRFFCGDDQPLVYARKLEAVAKQIKDDVDLIARMNKRIPEFKPFEERPVKEVTTMLLNEKNIRVIVKGDEGGMYWFKSEYDKARPGFAWVKNNKEG